MSTRSGELERSNSHIHMCLPPRTVLSALASHIKDVDVTLATSINNDPLVWIRMSYGADNSESALRNIDVSVQPTLTSSPSERQVLAVRCDPPVCTVSVKPKWFSTRLTPDRTRFRMQRHETRGKPEQGVSRRRERTY
jgi:hypothetical protein